MNEKFKIAPDTNKIRVTGDRNTPLISALLSLPAEAKSELGKVIEVIPADGYALTVFEHEDDSTVAECPFCNAYQMVKEINERPNPRNHGEYTNKYTVALVSESYWNGEFTGSVKHCDYELNFCPVCGRPIKEEK